MSDAQLACAAFAAPFLILTIIYGAAMAAYAVFQDDEGLALVTRYDQKPIPSRRFDWSAVLDGYEPGDPIGYGETEDEAIDELKSMLEAAE